MSLRAALHWMGLALALGAVGAPCPAAGRGFKNFRRAPIRSAAAPVAADPTVALLQLLTTTTAGQECTGTAITSFTTTRSSGAFCEKSDGTLVWLTTNQPRRQTAGLLVENTATNELAATEDITAATWSVAGSATRSADTQASPDGGTTADTLTLLASSSSRGFTNKTSGVPNTTAYVQSFYTKAASAITGYHLTDDASVCTGSAVHSFTTSTSWQRVSQSWTSRTNGQFQLSIGGDVCTPTATGAGSIFVWGSQMEQGKHASSYYPSLGAINTTGTRGADIATIANPFNPSNPTTWCLGSTVTPYGSHTWANNEADNGVMHIGATSTGANSAALYVRQSDSHLVFSVYDTTGTVKTIASNAAVTDGARAFRACSTSGTLTIFVDGSAPASTVTGTGLGTIATQPATISIGYLADVGKYANASHSVLCFDNNGTACP